jgi:hypothetical protein
MRRAALPAYEATAQATARAAKAVGLRERCASSLDAYDARDDLGVRRFDLQIFLEPAQHVVDFLDRASRHSQLVVDGSGQVLEPEGAGDRDRGLLELGVLGAATTRG